jgi:hypothetical protein
VLIESYLKAINHGEELKMKRQEAVGIVKEIGATCKLLNPKKINLESTVVGHYEIHIESVVDNETWLRLKDIAKKYLLGVKLTDNVLIIYRPENKESTKNS